MSRLYDVENPLDESIQGFVLAVTTNPENRKYKEGFARQPSFMLKANRHGSVNLPYVDKDLKKTNPVSSVTLPNGLDIQTGVLYIKEAGINKYLWAVERETGTRFTITTSAGDRPVTIVNTSEVTGLPAQYIFAPIDAFGNINSQGRSEGISATFGSVASRYERDVEEKDRSERNFQEWVARNGVGYRAPRLVAAPALPFGYGNVSGLRVLAGLHSEGQYRGWEKETCREAFAAVRAMDTLAAIARRVYPMCELWNEKYTPIFMRSADKKLNESTAVLASLFDRIKDPIWCKIPIKQEVDEIDRFVIGEGLVDTEARPINLEFNVEEITDIARDFGYDGMDALRDETRKDIARVLQSDDITPQLREALKNEDQRKALVAAYSSKTKTNLGHAYADLLKEKGLEENPSTSIASFMEHEVIPTMKSTAVNSEQRLQRAVLVFNAVLGVALASSLSNKRSSHHTSKSISELIQQAKSFASSKRKNTTLDDEDVPSKMRNTIGGARKVEASKETLTYINTRLTISERGFQTLGAESESDEEIQARLHNSILRPSDPNNLNRPLGVSDTDKAVVRNVQYARAHAPRGGLDHTIFANAHLIGESKRFEDISEKGVEIYGFGERHLPPALINDMTGSLYESGLDSDGIPLSHTHNVTQKKYLVWRFEELSSIPDTFTRMGAQLLCLSKVHRDSLRTWVKEGLPIPDCCYIFAQPFIQIRTSSGLWAKGGAGTASTGYNYEDVVLEFDGSHKIWNLHYTIWMNCAVQDPTKFIIMQDIKFEGYVRGMDDSINDNPAEFDPENIDLNQLKSAWVFSCGATFSRDIARKTANPLVLYGRYDRRAMPYNFSDPARIFAANRPLWPSYPFYDYLWSFSSLNSGQDLDNSSFAAVRESTFLTTVMPMGTHLIFDEHTQKLTQKVEGSDHLAKFDVPMKPILNGKVEYPINKQY
jgi:hypothetical protein